ncbi:MAG: putative lipid II flippase FtsW [Candidatus Gottesmanbacteria bacterium]|nr:putative lipid II flippase FtsW [Candidatus Gottesmanbacteria bacterium]
MKFPFFNILRKKKASAPDRLMLLAVVVLSLFGLLMVYDSSVAIAVRDFGNQYYYLRDQLKWLAVGFAALTVFSFIDYHAWYKIALPILLVTLVLLLAVFIPGVGVRALGAHRWINFGFFVLQPAEFAKLALVIYLSAWFSVRERGRFAAFALLVAMVVGLVLLEPDLGTSVVIVAIALILYFASGAPVLHFVVILPVLVAGILVLAIISPYRMARLTTFLHPEQDPLGSSYHIRQALLGLGSGGWFGVGVGQSRQKYEYLPEANTDSIFAIIGEETGYVGGVAVILMFVFTSWRGFRIAKRAQDGFGRLLAIGVTSWISLQSIINLSAMVALLPLTGVPLPFVSYGGSSLIVVLAAVGILLNISKTQ